MRGQKESRIKLYKSPDSAWSFCKDDFRWKKWRLKFQLYKRVPTPFAFLYGIIIALYTCTCIHAPSKFCILYVWTTRLLNLTEYYHYLNIELGHCTLLRCNNPFFFVPYGGVAVRSGCANRSFLICQPWFTFHAVQKSFQCAAFPTPGSVISYGRKVYAWKSSALFLCLYLEFKMNWVKILNRFRNFCRQIGSEMFEM